MLLREYLQSKYSISRRNFTQLVDEHKIFLNQKIVDSYKQEVIHGDFLKIEDAKYPLDEKIVVSEEKKADSLLVLFNKPMGYVVSKSDPHNQTIYELLPEEFQGFYYIGRLDKDSHGLMLLTNDPKLVHAFEHPKFEIEKEYIVKIDRPFRFADVSKMKAGILDEGELLKIKNLEIISQEDHTLTVLLHEGKKRHIRRIFKALGYRVEDLQRVREGEYELGNLELNAWKKVSVSL